MNKTESFCPCRGAGMYLVELEGGRFVMRVCDCPAGHRRKEYLGEPDERRPREVRKTEEELPF